MNETEIVPETAADRRANSRYMAADQARMALAQRYFAWLAKLVRPHLGQRILEIGSSIGNFTGMLLDREAVLAVDVERWAVDAVRERYAGHGNLEARLADLGAEEFVALSRFRADTCVCMNVLEHISDDRAALRRMGTVVEDGGKVILVVPAFPALYGPIDRRLGHFRRYTRRGIGELAASAGLRIETMRYVNVAGFFGWWINAHVLRREAQSEAQIRFFDRWIVPMESRMEQLIHPPFGQSLFVVLEKP